MQTKVKILDIKDIPVELWFENEKIGIIETILQFHDILCQIKVQKLSGYYLIFTRHDVTKRIDIRNNGTLDDTPPGLFDVLENQLDFLCGWGERGWIK